MKTGEGQLVENDELMTGWRRVGKEKNDETANDNLRRDSAFQCELRKGRCLVHP
jgi:hypothetical protein